MLKSSKLSLLVSFLALSLPIFAFAALVPTCGANCNWGDLVGTAQTLIDYLIKISATIAAVSFSYAGYLYLTAGGDSGKVSRAHGIFKKVAIGFIVALAAWLIVNTILKGLLNSDFYQGSFLKNN